MEVATIIRKLLSSPLSLKEYTPYIWQRFRCRQQRRCQCPNYSSNSDVVVFVVNLEPTLSLSHCRQNDTNTNGEVSVTKKKISMSLSSVAPTPQRHLCRQPCHLHYNRTFVVNSGINMTFPWSCSQRVYVTPTLVDDNEVAFSVDDMAPTLKSRSFSSTWHQHYFHRD